MEIFEDDRFKSELILATYTTEEQYAKNEILVKRK